MVAGRKKTDKKELSFEEELDRLECIVEKLESEEVSLEKALDLFEEGTTLVKSAQKKLRKSQLKVKKVLGEEGGELILDDFLPADDGSLKDEES
jgi:exodeoxyribonuclease VII small subunit